MRRVLLSVVVASVAWLGCPSRVAAADIAPCQTCHTGSSRQSLAPTLDGQHAEYLVNQLTRFRDHVREAFPMDALAQGLDDAVIARLAQAFSARDWPAYQGQTDAAAVARGADLGVRYACASCHGDDLHGAGAIPRVAGQQADYLARQIAAFGADDRYHPPTGNGARMYALDTAQAADLAAWLARQP